MTTEFRVLNENTFDYKNGKLYLILLRDADKFGVEVVDRAKTFGRKHFADLAQAKEVFELISKKLASSKTLDTAESLIKAALGKKNSLETIFILTVANKKLCQDSIGDLTNKFKFKVKSRYNLLGDEKKRGAITIHVFFGDKKKPTGRFKGTRFGSDFIFENL